MSRGWFPIFNDNGDIKNIKNDFVLFFGLTVPIKWQFFGFFIYWKILPRLNTALYHNSQISNWVLTSVPSCSSSQVGLLASQTSLSPESALLMVTFGWRKADCPVVPCGLLLNACNCQVPTLVERSLQSEMMDEALSSVDRGAFLLLGIPLSVTLEVCAR